MSPSVAVSLILCMPIWSFTDALRPLLFGRLAPWRGLVVRAAPFAFGVALCHVPGLLDLLVYDLCRYEPPLRWFDPFAVGVMAGACATSLHALGLREGLTRVLVGRLRALLPGG